MGICFYCQKPATKKARMLSSAEIVNVCDYHAEYMKQCENGKNIGAGAGIG